MGVNLSKRIKYGYGCPNVMLDFRSEIWNVQTCDGADGRFMSCFIEYQLWIFPQHDRTHGWPWTRTHATCLHHSMRWLLIAPGGKWSLNENLPSSFFKCSPVRRAYAISSHLVQSTSEVQKSKLFVWVRLVKRIDGLRTHNSLPLSDWFFNNWATDTI